ncbi:TetR/AcrR family transcriptional regulator [Inquilinus limosus]|uniref:TetR/AcrR family transcriptional regulator n=1 Tax=Inquilinus limosus TaxID=171674 RepID=UPI000409124B|nr:TetR/AcrR family transcriptional regulator [Inquilinus limosus]
MPELKPVFSLPDARDLILEAALAAFAERGFHGAGMRDIAARAGVSQSLLHHHFGTKEALWNLVGERISADFLDYMAEAIAPDVPAAESVPRALRSYMAYWKEHPAAFRFNLWRLLEGPAGERKTRSATLNARAVPVFERAHQAGFIRSDMPPGLAMIIGGSLIQFWLHSQTEIRDALAVTGAEPPTDDAFIDCILGLIGPDRTQTETR